MILPKWTGDNSDRSLISLAQFLQEVPSLPLVFDVDETRSETNSKLMFTFLRFTPIVKLPN